MRLSRKLLFVLVAGLVLYVIISRLHIVVLVHVSFLQGLCIVGVIILVLFLGLDQLINGTRSPRSEE